MTPFRQVGIFSLGLMGGSLAGALHRARFAGRVVAQSGNAESIRLGRERGWLHEGHADPARAAQGCDLIVLCAPILNIADSLRAALPGIAPGTIVTDLGSTKSWLAAELPRVLRDGGVPATYVPAHPMCGSEKSGFEFSDPALYENRTCAVCRDEGIPSQAVDRVTEFWQALGSRVAHMTSAEHDRWTARTSHLPHMAASLLAHTVGCGGELEPGLLSMVGSGFTDTSRLAEGSPTVWKQITATNHCEILAALDAYAGRLDHLRAEIRAGAANGDWSGVERFLAEGVQGRLRLVPPKADGHGA